MAPGNEHPQHPLPTGPVEGVPNIMHACPLEATNTFHYLLHGEMTCNHPGGRTHSGKLTHQSSIRLRQPRERLSYTARRKDTLTSCAMDRKGRPQRTLRQVAGKPGRTLPERGGMWDSKKRHENLPLQNRMNADMITLHSMCNVPLKGQHPMVDGCVYMARKCAPHLSR